MPGEDVITRFDNAGVEMSLMIEGGNSVASKLSCFKNLLAC